MGDMRENRCLHPPVPWSSHATPLYGWYSTGAGQHKFRRRYLVHCDPERHYFVCPAHQRILYRKKRFKSGHEPLEAIYDPTLPNSRLQVEIKVVLMWRCHFAEPWWLVKPLAAVAGHLGIRERFCHGMPSWVSCLLHQHQQVQSATQLWWQTKRYHT